MNGALLRGGILAYSVREIRVAERFIGVDIQERRRCPYAVLDASARMVDSGWLAAGPYEDAARDLVDVVRRHGNAPVGIDSPRRPLAEPRAWSWGRGRWRPRGAAGQGNGRHCEVVVKAHNLANPQWTRTRDECPSWMRLGFALFEAVNSGAPTYEVFPSASYRLLGKGDRVEANIEFSQFLPGPKDMLDAVVAALTVREYLAGRGCAVGDGDGLGAIILPRPLAKSIPEVDRWPGAAAGDL